MKKLALFSFLVLLCAANLRADDQIATVQQELKDQGFYYGEVDGQPGPETTAAIRRYQIRNGLPVDGAFNKQTLDSLKVAGPASTGAPAPVAKTEALPPPPAPLEGEQQQPVAPVQPGVSQSDQEFLQKQNGTVAPAPAPPVAVATNVAQPPPQPQPAPEVQQPQPEAPQAPPLNVQYSILFTRTPYQNAPLEVQQGTVRNAQLELARLTFYNGEVDGVPGPMTARAILAYQNNIGLPPSGRLDLGTLAALRLLPNQAAPVRRVIIEPFYPAPRYYVQPPRVYHGWVD